jgi:hypothetical protein
MRQARNPSTPRLASACVLLLGACSQQPVPSSTTCVVDGPEALLHATTGNSATPVLIAVDDGLLAIWEENDGADPGALVAQRLDDQGVGTGDPAPVAQLAAWGPQPQAVRMPDGDILLVWLDGAESCGPVVARVVSPDGVPVTEPAVLPSSGDAACTAPSVAWLADGAVVTWAAEPEEDQMHLWAAPFAPGSGWGTPVQVTTSGGAGTPRMLGDGDEAVVLWSDVGEGAPAIWIARLDADGNAVSGPALLIDDSSIRYAEPARAGGQVVVVWDTRADREDSWLLRAPLNGIELGDAVPFSDGVEGSVNDVSNVTSGDLQGVAWSDDRGNRVYASVSDAEGNRASGDLRLAEDAAGFGLQPTIARTTSGFLALWRDTRERTGGDLYVRTIACD